MAAPAVVTTKEKNSKAIIPVEWAKQNYAKTRWMVIQVTRQSYSVGIIAGSEYIYEYFVYKNDGSSVRYGKIGSDIVAPVLGSTQAWRDSAAQKQKNFKAAVQKLKTFAAEPNDPEGSDDEAIVSRDVPIQGKNLDKINYNPPPHRATRSPSLFYMANIERNFIKDSTPYIDSTKAYNNFTAPNKNLLPLGRIYQTESTAKALNKKYLEQKQGNKCLTDTFLTDLLRSGTGLWGFRFLYNPTTISYNNQVDTSIDWFLNQQDPSRFFGGNMTISFDLYLNRIADLATLRNVNGRIISKSDDYPGFNFDEEDAKGLYYRGTEYDLEYLYRCVNGGPIPTSLTSEALPTADFGYIAGSPLWIHLHDNLRFKGSLVGLNVTHVSFSDRMVPMLSVVNLSFIRYPELEAIGNETEVLEALKASGAKGGTGSSLIPPGKTGK